MDIYAEVTNRIISEMEQGIIPWQKPWIASGAAVSHTTGKTYSLLNQMLLGRPGEWLTFNQCKAEGGSVRKGEKARLVVFWKWLEEPDKETGEMKRTPFLRYYNVFHIDQCDGITPKRKPLETTASPDGTADAIISEYITREGITLENREGDAAFYRPSTDSIVLPLMDQFTETAEYYSAAFHELTHSTGHPKRLARLDITANFGSEGYSKEELVAEIGSAALVHHCGLETKGSFHNSAAYLQNWLKALKDDKRFIISAASKAEKAVSYILTGA